MTWNWQHRDWPHFQYDISQLANFEADFLLKSGIFLGTYRHIDKEAQIDFIVDTLSNEALKTSEIEGEYLDRESVKLSVLRNFGLDKSQQNIPLAEQGIADMMMDLYHTFNAPLSDEMLFRWHRLLTSGRHDLHDIGCYRTHGDAMQVVSGYMGTIKVHFQAPPSVSVKNEMLQFIQWFNETGQNGKTPLSPLVRTSIAHLYFVCIHPFEDGNGRIGRAIAEKALSQGLGQPTLIALSQEIQKDRKEYYLMLEKSNKEIEITPWIDYFSKTILNAQNNTQKLMDFLIQKTKFYDRAANKINDRQSKVLARIFREGSNGFEGGLSAEKYIKITGTSKATATRDLQDLVKKGFLERTGTLKTTRYSLKL